MAAKSNPPFHAEHIGSLLRPDELRREFRAFSAGELSADAFAEAQNRCIREAVAMQEDVGLQGITDGESRDPLTLHYTFSRWTQCDRPIRLFRDRGLF